MSVVQPTDFSPNSFVQDSAAISNFVSLGAFVNEVDMPDNIRELVRPYGDQRVSGPYGLLSLVGATSAAGTNDEKQWWEEARLHATADGTIASTSPSDTGGKLITSTAHKVKEKDVVLINGTIRARCSARNSANSYTVIPLGTTWGVTFAANAAVKVAIIGNMWGQGTDQPTLYLEANVRKLTNTYAIIKNLYAATGSAMTNIGWIDLPDGRKCWYHKGELDARHRFEDYLEMMLMLGQSADNTNLTDINGSVGYFDAVESRGIVNNGYLTDLADWEDLVKAFDKQGATPEYAGYFNTDQMLLNDRMVAAAAGGLGTSSYGMFNNSKDMAVNLGFKSHSIGGYTFHNHGWKLLNDPTLLGHFTDTYKGVLVPMTTVVDPKTGESAPALEKCYKSAEGYSREVETWMTGAARGVYTDSAGNDSLKFNFRSEIMLVTRAANRHVVIK